MKHLGAIVASVASALLASACCLPLLGALIFGLSSSFASTLHAWRPFFWVLTGISLAAAFYLTYKKPKKCCDFEKKTCWENNLRLRKILLWVVVVINLIVILYPYLFL